MEARRPAGAPEEEPRPAGAPQAEAPQGQPASNPAAPGRGSEAREASGDGERGPRESEEAAGVVQKDLDALESTKRERDEYLELAQRTRADFDNYRKRVAAETKEAAQRGKAELARGLLPVLDNLERAMQVAEIGEGTEDPLEQGILLTYRELRSTLEQAGVEAIDPAGEKFDPEWHEAVSTRADGAGRGGEVLEVLQKGYRIGPQLIRPARVVVGE